MCDLVSRRQGVCELRGDLYPTVATRWHWALPVQRLWALPQDEWAEPTPDQAQAKAGEWSLRSIDPILTSWCS